MNNNSFRGGYLMKLNMYNLPERNKNVTTVIICAVNHVMRTALKHISTSGRKQKVRVISLYHLGDIIQATEQYSPDCIIIDSTPRQCVFLLYTLRFRFGCLPVIFTCKDFLFSDRIASEFFGSVLLRDYDVLMNSFPNIPPVDLSHNDMFSGPEYSGSAPVYKVTPSIGISEDTLIRILNIWLLYRLPGIVPSATGRNVIMSCLIDNMSIEKIANRMKISDKSIYYHRSKIMKMLGIRRTSHDFIKSFRFYKDIYYETTAPTSVSPRG